MALSDEKGNFCLTLITYRGNADVSIMGQEGTVQIALTQ
jgi:hypothetical protein